MTDPRDPQPYDPFEGPPTSPPSAPPSAPPTAPVDGSQPEHVIHYGPPQHEVYGGAFQDAPDPFTRSDPTATAAGTVKKKGSPKRWIIPIAALVVIAMVAAGSYFLFFQSDDDSETDASTTTSETTERTEQSSPPETSADSPAGPAPEPLIAGVFEVNGTVESYTGPPTGQLGAPPKTEGSPAFTTPQTWTIDSCTDDTCELSIAPGDVTVTLELDGDTWTGEGEQMIACDPAASATTEATLLVEIAQDGSSATRTLNATCDEPLTEVNSLTLTAQ